MRRDQAEAIAASLREKGERWKSREWLIQLRAPTPAETATEEGAAEPRIPVRLSSEAPVERYDWWNDQLYTEILDHAAVDLTYARDGLPFCLDHWTEKQIGLVEDVAVKDGELVGMVRFGSHPDAEWVEQDILDGIRKKVSIGYVQGEYSVVGKVKPGEPETRRYAFMPLEGSSVCIPADYEVGFGRSYLRALRSPNTVRPETAPTGQESTMPAPVAAAPDTGAEDRAAEERAADKLRIERLRGLIESQGADATDVVRWISEGKSVREAMDELATQLAAAREAGEARKVRTGAAPDVFVRSGKGAIGRDGKVKEGEDGGFESPGDFLRAVALAAMPGGRRDPRLSMERAASGQSEGSASDGGFMVPKLVQSAFTAPLWETGAILSRVNRIPITTGNGMKLVRIDETSRANGSRGGAIVSYWANEADTIAGAGKVKLREHNLDLKKLFALGYATEELIEDAPALEAEMKPQFTSELLFKAEDAVINGNGNGQPLGILNSGAVVSVAIEAAQTIANTAASIAINVAKMKSRVPAALYQRCVWLMNPDLEPSLIAATLGGTSAAMPVYMPPGGLSAAPYGSILGRPVIFTEYNPAVGTPGDIMLVDLGSYDMAEKGGIRSTASSEVRFLYDEMTFKFTYRLDGQPAFRSAITPFKGTNTKSPYVTLAVRS